VALHGYRSPRTIHLNFLQFYTIILFDQFSITWPVFQVAAPEPFNFSHPSEWEKWYVDLAPLYALLQKRSIWKWGSQQEKAFSTVKSQLTSECLLTHSDPQKPLTLSCNASPYGIGAVLSHRLSDGSKRPIAFASRSLSPVEKGYAQLDKEALAIVFSVTKISCLLVGSFFYNLLTRPQTIITPFQSKQSCFSYSFC